MAEIPEENPLQVEKLTKKFKSSEKLMKQEFLPKYQIARRRLRSEYQVTGRNTSKMTHDQVNLVYSIGYSMKNSIYFKAPDVNLTPREGADPVQVENTEAKVNDWLKEKGVKRNLERVIWDAYLGGFGALFIDYAYDDLETDQVLGYRPGPGLDPSTGQPIQVPVFARQVLRNEIIAKRIRPDLVRFPRGFDFDNYQESPWIGFDMIIPEEEAKSEENWDPEQRDRLKGQKYNKLSAWAESERAEDSEDLYCKIHYVFMKPQEKGGQFQMIVFSEDGDKPLLQEVFDKGHNGYPIQFLVFNPLDDDCPYPNGDPWIWESQLNAVDKWWKSYRIHVERSHPKTVFDSSSVDDKEISKLNSGNDLEFVGVKNKKGQPLQNLFFERERAGVHPQVTEFYTVAKGLLNELAPRSGMSRGNEDPKDKTATQARIEATGEIIDVEARIDDLRDFIEEVVLDVAGILTKINSTMPVTIEDQQTGKEFYREVGAEGFTNRIKADVSVDSMQAPNKEVYRRQLIDAIGLLNTLEPMMNKVGLTIEPKFWIEKLLDTMNIKDAEKGIMPLPPMLPMAAPGMEQAPGGISTPEPSKNQASDSSGRDLYANELQQI